MMLSEGLILSGYPNHSRKIARLDALDATATDTPKLKSSDVAMLSNFLRTALESVLRAGPAVNDLQLQCLRSTLTHFKRQLSCKDDVYWGLVAVSEQVVLTASDPSWQDYENLRAFFFEAGLGAAASARCASIAARSVCSPRDLAQKAQAQKTDTKAVGVGVGGVGVVGVGLMDFQLSDAQSQLLCAALTALDPPQFLQSLSQDPLSNSAVSPLSVSMWSDVPSSTPAPTPALTPAPTLEPSDSPPAPPAPSSSTHPPTAHTPTPHAHSHPHTHTHWVDDFSNSILHSVAKELAEEVAHQSMLQSQSQSQELQPPSGAEALSVSVVVPVTAQERYQYEVETGLFAEDTFGMGVGMGVGVGAMKLRTMAPTLTQTASTANEFAGVERFCRNAGASSAGLAAFLEKVRSSERVAMAVLWRCATSSHASSTVKYCTPTSACVNWFCTCDRQVRAQYAAHNLLGVVVRIPAEETIVYFLPIGQCLDDSNPSSPRSYPSSSTPTDYRIPLQCRTSPQQRVAALATVLSLPTLKVTYNTQLALIPLYLQIRSSSPHDPAPPAGLSCFSESAPRPMPSHPEESAPRPSAAFCLHTCHNFSDPRIAAYLCDSDIPEAQLELEQLFDRCKIRSEYQDVAGLGRFAKAISKVKSELHSLLALTAMLEGQLEARGLGGVGGIYRGIEMPTACLLGSCELTGVVVSASFLDTLKVTLQGKINQVEESIFQQAGTRINVASPEQVSRLLFDELKLPPPSHTSKKGKHHSTSEEDLLRIKHLHPVVELILQFRALNKLSSTYIDGVRGFMCGESAMMRRALGLESMGTGTGPPQQRVHANWQQTIVRTGRLSCTKPNLQNVPNQQTVAGLEVNMRSAFQATRGCVLVSADYSQIEMRVLAHLCADPVMLSLFRAGGDIYTRLAAKIMDKSVEGVVPAERTKAKVICLGVLYGMGPAAAAAKLNIEVSAAARITQSFFNHFKQMKAWTAKIKAQARQCGFVRTMLGRMRHLPDISSPDQGKAAHAERQAVNSVIQGTASDIIKYAMINVDRALSQQWPAEAQAPRLLMQIHDELIYEIDEPDLARFTHLLHSAMETDVVAALHLTVPLIVNIHMGQTWGDVK